jgi:hypothetical protein
MLSGKKDPSTDLWTLPLGSNQGKTSHHVNNKILPAAPVYANAHANMTAQIAFFMHTIRNKANSICFAHQSLCSPKISTLLKTIKRGYLKGCPNLTANEVTKCLNPSPATAKGHMKRPRQGIQSTRANHIRPIGASANTPPPIAIKDTDGYKGFVPRIHNPSTNPNVIENDNE